ncbi:MAG: hypothetical protein VYB46_08560 [Pseudomonadota bacterium]|nr:hypothetical protein [Pseudomonadota bacterium]
MAKKAEDQAKAAAAAEAQDPAVSAPADPAPATDLQNPSGAIMEPEVAKAVDLTHESVDANPRAGTTSTQNAIDWNDAKSARPQDKNVAGQGLDTSVYGKGAKA